MNEDDLDNQLVPAEHGLALTNLSDNRILSEMVGASLTLVRQELTTAEMAEEYFEIGNRCFYGDQGAPEGQTEGISWYLMAAMLGHAHAQYFLGQCYEDGLGVPIDAVEACKWFKLAAAQGHEEAKEQATALAARMSSTASETAQPKDLLGAIDEISLVPKLPFGNALIQETPVSLPPHASPRLINGSRPRHNRRPCAAAIMSAIRTWRIL